MFCFVFLYCFPFSLVRGKNYFFCVRKIESFKFEIFMFQLSTRGNKKNKHTIFRQHFMHWLAAEGLFNAKILFFFKRSNRMRFFFVIFAFLNNNNNFL
jgi:hypothetical protein